MERFILHIACAKWHQIRMSAFMIHTVSVLSVIQAVKPVLARGQWEQGCSRHVLWNPMVHKGVSVGTLACMASSQAHALQKSIAFVACLAQGTTNHDYDHQCTSVGVVPKPSCYYYYC
jgi:hypothetical protein